MNKSYDPTNKNVYYHLDEQYMFVERNDINSWKDSIGRNFDAYVAWKDFKLVKAVKNCFDFPVCEQFQRHPKKTTGEVSRDHLSYALILFLYIDKRDWFFEVADKLKWKFNHKHSLRGMYLWYKSFYGSGWRFLFYSVKIPELLLMLLINNLVRKWAKVQPERSQDEWNIEITKNRTERQKKAFYMCLPAYALYNFAWQLKVMPNTRAKKVLQKIALQIAGKHNYVIRHLLGDRNIDLNLVLSYRSMKSSRWTTTTDELNNRDLIETEPQEANDLDKDYLLGVLASEFVEIK